MSKQGATGKKKRRENWGCTRKLESVPDGGPATTRKAAELFWEAQEMSGGLESWVGGQEEESLVSRAGSFRVCRDQSRD